MRNAMSTDAAAVWRARLRDLLHDCVASAPAEQTDRIREAGRLFAHAAQEGLPVQTPVSEDAKLTAMLECGAFESAVLSLIGSETSFMLSRGGNGSCLASVVLPDGSEEMIAEGSTLALALLAAHLATVLADTGEDGADDFSAVLPSAAGSRLN